MSKCLSFLTTNVSNNLPRAYFSKIKVGILRKKQQIIIKDLKMFFFTHKSHSKAENYISA